ncbi:hypothetical protein IKQ21_02645 [bacterium]|nr:hypothetical protein [bacterium]
MKLQRKKERKKEDMINPIARTQEVNLFNHLTGNAQAIRNNIQNLKNIGITQAEILLRTIAEQTRNGNTEFIEASKRMYDKLYSGLSFSEAVAEVKPFLENEAAIKITPLGIAVMAKGWSKPVVFPKAENFKFLGWADIPANFNTNNLWTGAYGKKQPKLIMGAVGNSNIKPEQVKGGCALTKKELSAQYEGAIQDFYNPIIDYLKEQGAKTEDIGFAFAHSDCGVDKAVRNVVEKHNLKGFGITPTEYTQYLRGKEMPANEEFPDGYILADFPFPTILTRNISQIEDYAKVYGKMVGKGNPLGVFGGGEHAFARDAREALIGQGGANSIPVDIMRDKFGVVIPATRINDKGEEVVTNAARDMLERVNGNPYEQYRYAFNNFLPSSRLKEDIAQYDPQAAMATVAYAKLAQAGKIGKINSR